MLEAIRLSKSYNGTPALDALDLKVESGEIFCLLGANGAGKTTTINLFLGFLKPTSGAAKVAGQDVQADPLAARRQIAYIPEQVMLYPNFSGLENLQYFSDLAGRDYSPAELRAFLLEAGLPEEAILRRVGGYSKGMRQKVGIAVALAKQARAILMDEPTSGLDPKASNEFSQLLEQLSKKGVCILMATHDLFRAKEVGHRVGIMKHGRLVTVLGTADMSHLDLERTYLDHMRD
jgi:ABC-2 type transport system ATP-binding protein